MNILVDMVDILSRYIQQIQIFLEKSDFFLVRANKASKVLFIFVIELNVDSRKNLFVEIEYSKFYNLLKYDSATFKILIGKQYSSILGEDKNDKNDEANKKATYQSGIWRAKLQDQKMLKYEKLTTEQIFSII